MVELPSLYDLYTSGGINSGLTDYKNAFLLNGKEFRIYGGSMDYFRVHPQYWRNRIQEMKSAGLNTVTTNIPWNLHEPSPGIFEFGKSPKNYAEFLDVAKFLRTIQEEDMFAIIRPGPYIGADVDLGGLPSWLLREEGINMRTNDDKFMMPVKRYFNVLLALLTIFQFTKGGPIIAFEIEADGKSDYTNILRYTSAFKQMYTNHNIVEMLFSSNLSPLQAKVLDMLYAVKLNMSNTKNLQLLKMSQGSRPTFVIEYQSGSAQAWGELHPTISSMDFAKGLYNIIRQNASFNIHMFHGGSNFGFISGARHEGSSIITSSYDYNAPLTEAGDYTEKYFLTKSILYVYGRINTKVPERPKHSLRSAHKSFHIVNQVTLGNLLDNIEPIYRSTSGVISMELLPTKNEAGQGFGFIVYRAVDVTIPLETKIKIFGTIHDSVMVLINGKIISKHIAYENLGEYTNLTITTSSSEFFSNATLDILVENFGRSQNTKEINGQYKGLWEGNVTINDYEILDWFIYSLDFKKSFLDNVTVWSAPKVYDGWPTFNMGGFKADKLSDSFLDMRNWYKGTVIVNDFVLSKYFKGGPQQTIYLPAPLLKKVWNEIIIFEQLSSCLTVEFSKDPIFDLIEEY